MVMYKWYGSEYARHRRSASYHPKRGVSVAKIGTTRWPSCRTEDQTVRVINRLLGNKVRKFQETHSTSQIDVTSFGDVTFHALPGRSSSTWVIDYHLSGDGVGEYQRLCAKRGPYHQVRASGLCIGIITQDWKMSASKLDAKNIEALVCMSIHVNPYQLPYFPIYAIANLIDPRIPYVVRRLTYKRRKGWSFPHQPYCNVIRQRRRDAWADAMDEAERRDYYEGDDDDE